MNNDKNKYKSIKDFSGIQDYLKYQKISADKYYTKKDSIDYLKSNKDMSYDNPKDFIEIRKIDFQPLMSAPPTITSVTPEEEKEAIDIFTLQDSVENGKKISRLFSMSGLVYKFNRGLVMIDATGKKVEEVLDRTSNHHADRLSKIATDDFGRNIAYQGPSTEFTEGLEAASKGLVTMLLEGNKCILIVPNNLTIEAIDGIISELEPRDEFVFTVVKEDGVFVENLSRDQVLDYYKYQKKKKDNSKEKPQTEEKNNKLSIDEYIKELIKFLDEKNISLIEYFRNIGKIHRRKDNEYLPEFERKNPFIDENDIRLLLESDDNMIVEYFARLMFKVINLNIASAKKHQVTTAGEYSGSDDYKKSESEKKSSSKNNDKEEKEEQPDKKQQKPKLTSKDLIAMLKEEPQSIVEQINEEILDDTDGYAVVRDADCINIYSYSSNDRSSLKERTTYSASDYDIKSGYYVSINEFLHNICNKHANCKVSFITETGVEIDYNTIKTTLEELCIEQGGITLENDSKISYYINRGDLRVFLSKFRAKYTPYPERNNSIKM